MLLVCIYSISSEDFDDDNLVYGPERIVERRYYIRNSASLPKRDQFTSTTDLRLCGSKIRQLSGESSITAPTIYSQCSASTPTYAENLRYQSDILRNEINVLKHEIGQLQASQERFFTQIETQFQSNINPATATETLGKHYFCFCFRFILMI